MLFKDLLLEVVREASLKKDAENGLKAERIIKYIENKVSKFRDNNHAIKVIRKGNTTAVVIQINDLRIILTDVTRGTWRGAFKKEKNTIFIYRCAIEIKPLKVDFNHSALKHEITHYFDIQSNQGNQNHINKLVKVMDNPNASPDKKYKAYINSPYEMNAFFFQHVIPIVLQYVKKEKDLPDNFNAFKEVIFNDYEVKDLYNHLNSNNKQKFLKRIAKYWQEIISKEISTSNGDIDNRELEKKTYSWWDHIKDTF